MSVPFENLDIHLGHRVALDEESLFQKIVGRARGGFCYELNGLFGAALRQIGFDVRFLSAMVIDANGELGREFVHLLLLVQLEDAWIADVGFGDWFTEPLRFEEGTEQIVDQTSYRVVRKDDRYEIDRKRNGQSWTARYSFTLLPRELLDFSAMCGELQTGTDSYFRINRICTLPTLQGRISLINDKLIEITCGNRIEQVLNSEDDFARALKRHFAILLPR